MLGGLIQARCLAICQDRGLEMGASCQQRGGRADKPQPADGPLWKSPYSPQRHTRGCRKAQILTRGQLFGLWEDGELLQNHAFRTCVCQHPEQDAIEGGCSISLEERYCYQLFTPTPRSMEAQKRLYKNCYPSTGAGRKHGKGVTHREMLGCWGKPSG